MKKMATKNFQQFCDDHQGYAKVWHNGGTLVSVIIYNPETGDVKQFTVDDLDYHYGGGWICREYDLETLAILSDTPIHEEFQKLYRRDVLGIVSEGDDVRVIKGQKFPKGTAGKVLKTYTYRTPYGQEIPYCICDFGKIATENLEIAK